MIGRILGLGAAARQVGAAVSNVAEVFVGNRAEREAAEHARAVGTLAQFGEEFRHPGLGWFDQAVNGLNRLPRPMMAVGTLGLFGYAMVEPAGFSLRMQGLNYVPEPLWWLLGAVVSFYFGARELHHYRGRAPGPEVPAAKAEIPAPVAPRPEAARVPLARAATGPAPATRAEEPDFNAAVEEWRAATA